MRNKKGTIRVAKEHLDYYIDNHLDDNQVFKNFVPTSVSMDYMDDQIIFKGYSPMFRPLKEGESIPEYNVIIDVNDTDKKIKKVQFVEKVNESD